MALTSDQQAMLQLILERGQSYDDIAAVLGIGVDGVRTRARAALGELGGADPDAEVGLTDYLLGQADPIGRADAVRHLQGDANSRQLAATLVDRLREVAPGAELPEIPGPRERRGVLGRRRDAPGGGTGGGTGTAAAPPAAPRGPRLRDSLSRRQQQAIVGLGAGALIVLFAVLAIAGVFGGGGEPAPEPEAGQEPGQVLETVPLEPRGGSGASGEATFGLATEDQPYLDLTLEGLDSVGENETYVVWLLLTNREGYPLSPLQVGEDGGFSDRFPIPQFAIPIATRARFVEISLSENRALLRDLEQAVERERPILGYQGESVLRGEIPVGAREQAGGGEGGGGE